MYTITKEQLQEAVQNPESLKGLFPDAFEVELKAGRWYKYKDSNIHLVYVTKILSDRVHGYGFSMNGWADLRNWVDVNLTEATHKEVTEMLKDELVRRYGEDWENVKIKKCLFHGEGNKRTNIGVRHPEISINKNRIWNRNGCIFKDGVWAAKLEDVKPTFKPFQKVLVRDEDDLEWRINFFSNMNGDRFLTMFEIYWRQCIPYKGNEHLLGTTNKPP